MQKPTIGRIVIYKCGENDKKEMETIPQCNIQDELPAIVVAVWGEDCVNLKVMLDGQSSIWRTSVVKGDDEYNWNWPKREE